MKSIAYMNTNYPDVSIRECTITGNPRDMNGVQVNNVGRCRMYILYGGFGRSNPKAYMDGVVFDFVDRDMYNEFVESTMDNPWSRIIICDINNLLN